MSCLFLIILMLGSGQLVLCQEPSEKKDIPYVVQNPELITLEVLPRALELGENPSVFARPYKQGARLRFRLQMTNISIMPVEVPVDDVYAQNRPILYKDGDILPYRQQISDLLEAREKQPLERPGWRAKLEPNESKVLDRIDLYDWYEDLGPGHYQLSVKHRFQLGQSWYESSSITFEIAAKKSATGRRSK